MNRRITVLLAAVALAAPFLLAATPVPTPVPTPTPTPTPVVPPSIAQLCAATGIEEVDDLLADVATSELVGELSPLLTLVVPERDTVELDASVQLADVRERLNCDATPVPTTPPTPTPTATPTPTLSPGDDDDDGDFGQVGTPPSGGVATGTR